MNALHQQQWHDFLKAGLPTKRNERWKYADLTFLAQKKFNGAKRLDAEYVREKVNQRRIDNTIMLVCLNGYFMPALSDLNLLPEGVIARSLNEALQDQPALIEPHWVGMINQDKFPFARLNVTMFNDGLFLWLPENCIVDRPIHLLSLAADDHEFIAQPHHIFVLGKNSQLTLLEEHIAFTNKPYMMNMLTTISMAEGAVLEQQKIQKENMSAVHMASVFIRQNKDSKVSFTNFSVGGAFARDEITVTLQEPGAECKTAGFYNLTQDDQYIDQHVDINHLAPHSHSEMLYKGIIDKKSKAVFNGRLYVEKNAQKILAYQANHNLLLSKNAEVYSKPELEIYADDVKCKHGATTGQLNQEALFYLRARGIPEQEAVNMLLQSFASEIIDKVSHAGIKARCREAMQ